MSAPVVRDKCHRGRLAQAGRVSEDDFWRDLWVVVGLVCRSRDERVLHGHFGAPQQFL